MDAREVFLLCWYEKASYKKEEMGSLSLGQVVRECPSAGGCVLAKGVPGTLVTPCATQLSKMSPSRSCLVQGPEL